MTTDRESASPALCRLQLGSELRQLRLTAGLKGAQVVKKLLWSPSKLTRLETGENTTVEPTDVMALCEIYGADPERRAVLLSYAKVTKTNRDWWLTAEYRSVLKPGFKAFLDLEAAAETTQLCQVGFVPGLLQTEDYIREIHRRSDLEFTADEINRVVDIRITRQEVLVREESPLRYVSVVDEAVLRRVVGTPQIMRDQLAHIVETVESRPNVKVQVMPFAAGASRVMNGPFCIFRFPERLGLKPLVHIEHLADTWVKRDDADVKRFANAFTDLQAEALGPDESLRVIKEAIKEH
ncbi:Helix-turn-helix domain-containing protein [Actinacidiphila alni]|uniref:Helix-turn-helix domain-containing protein n=1 Tax=Actinacidiphila alni TaxID=380248 RepID=A0A1I2FA41_9ACTN|nr:helix-turn-helix transcriptional regulator [Actinacidiphila alni]SFF01391.1 Helix-turn-helix domain-containing protein [Actinacidiphila alni]